MESEGESEIQEKRICTGRQTWNNWARTGRHHRSKQVNLQQAANLRLVGARSLQPSASRDEITHSFKPHGKDTKDAERPDFAKPLKAQLVETPESVTGENMQRRIVRLWMQFFLGGACLGSAPPVHGNVSHCWPRCTRVACPTPQSSKMPFIGQLEVGRAWSCRYRRQTDLMAAPQAALLSPPNRLHGTLERECPRR